MNIARRNIEIAYTLTSPEDVIEGLREQSRFSSKITSGINALGIERDYYIMTSRKLGSNYSLDEIGNMFEIMKDTCRKHTKIPKSLFQLLVDYGEGVLKYDGVKPMCKREEIMNFRAISLKLGQNIFTTSFLAYRDVADCGQAAYDFSWNTVIDTDDQRLKHILSKGIAENHFHLTGSTPLFSLSWVALMNNPQRINRFFSSSGNDENPFRENRSKTISFFNHNRSLTWAQILKYAAWIRAELFQIVNGSPQKDLLKCFLNQTYELSGIHKLNRTVLRLRMIYGAVFPQPDQSKRCLDYAIRKNNLLMDMDSDSRLLYGERELMYRCFLWCFKNEFSEDAQNLFYLYLLLKARFRSELVQINSEVGFANFSIYQDRKSTFWEELPEYLAEAHRLAVNLTFNKSTVQSMEIRLVPKSSPLENIRRISEIDDNIVFAEECKKPPGALGRQMNIPVQTKFSPAKNTVTLRCSEAHKADICGEFPYFFVFHFIKSQLKPVCKPTGFGRLEARNHSVRQRNMQCALAIAKAMESNEYLCARVRGIDAASFEIACRPETFAVEFRFLKNFVPTESSMNLFTVKSRKRPKLGISYHVGEDFLDISDGLRAIDEAIGFLNLSRGDRLGHALALGVNPKTHYALKRNYIVLSKQDMLDNYVWLLFRSLELGVVINTNLRRKLESNAEHLLYEIYGKCIRNHHWNVSLDDYYHSWKLRGDNPACYSGIGFCNPYPYDRFFAMKTTAEKYRMYYVNDDGNDVFRRKENVAGILHYYHFGYDERVEGAKMTSRTITSEYENLMGEMQKKLRQVVSETGIAVECNLSSNYLIGTFGRYENHPIFQFNRHGLTPGTNHNEISVSLNTDDQGVFDTSLENEYAILVDCMSKMKDSDNNRLYSDETIYDYAEYLRQLGHMQTFPTFSD